MKNYIEAMKIAEELINMENDKITADELATEISVPIMLKGRTLHHFSKADRADMKKAHRQHDMELAELRKAAFDKAEKDGEVWFAGNYYKGTEYDYILNEVWKHSSDLWHPFTKVDPHKGIEKFYVADSDSKADGDNDPWEYEESGYWTEYIKAKQQAETIAASEIAEWKETANFYAGMANQFRTEVIALRQILKKNGIEF